MNNQTQIMPCDAARRRILRGGSSARPVRIAFEPDAGKVVVVDVRGLGRPGREGPQSYRRIPVSESGLSCGRCEPRDGQAVTVVAIRRAKSA